jgi:SNF2 family DNA or RNA helicase
LKGLLAKFRSKLSVDQGTDDANQKTLYAQNVAQSLTDAVKNGDTLLTEECSICLDKPLVQEAVVTPCAHVFCRACLVGYLRDKSKEGPSQDTECPYCNETMDASRIIALSKSSVSGQTTTSFLGAPKSPPSKKIAPTSNANSSARQFLEQALRGAGSAKLTAVLSELHNVWRLDPGSKVLIFSQFLGFLDLMEGTLREHDIPFGRLDGSMSLKERVTVLDNFKKPSSPTKSNNITRGSVLLISMKAGGVGINLVAASTVFIVDPWWNAAVEDQCVNRIHRIGQTAEVVRVRKFVVMDSVEERIVELQRKKQSVADQVFGDFGKNGAANGGAAATNPTLDDMRLIFGK